MLKRNEPEINGLGWWTISGEALMEIANRCYNGEHPSVVYAEFYANSEIERPNDAKDS